MRRRHVGFSWAFWRNPVEKLFFWTSFAFPPLSALPCADFAADAGAASGIAVFLLASASCSCGETIALQSESRGLGPGLLQIAKLNFLRRIVLSRVKRQTFLKPDCVGIYFMCRAQVTSAICSKWPVLKTLEFSHMFVPSDYRGVSVLCITDP